MRILRGPRRRLAAGTLPEPKAVVSLLHHRTLLICQTPIEAAMATVAVAANRAG
jgi:hypothetical protein